MPSTSRIFACLVATVVFVNAVLCACASAAVATTFPSEPPCCHDIDRGSTDRDPADHEPANEAPSPSHAPSPDCPHCQQSQVADTAKPTVAKPLVAPLAFLNCWSVEALLLPPTPLAMRVEASAVAKPLSLPMRLHCALTL